MLKLSAWMKPGFAIATAFALVATVAPFAGAGGDRPSPLLSSAPRTAQSASGTLDAYQRLAPVFVPNAGQTTADVLFQSQGSGYSFGFTATSARLGFAKADQAIALEMGFVGASSSTSPTAQRPAAGKANYFIGDDPSRWRSGLPTYEELTYPEIWPGIDLVFRGVGGQLKYELHAKSGANLDEIRLDYRGASGLSLDTDGNLQIATSLGVLIDARPVSYQEVDGRQIAVDSSFALTADGGYGFTVGAYDASRPLVIDPGIVYSTFLGGSGADSGTGIAVDAARNAYVTGFTVSANFPTVPGSYDTTYNGGLHDAFVAKLNPSGTGLLYATFLGGSGDDQATAIALDDLGSAYLTGSTTSTNFPTRAALPPPSVASDTSYNGGAHDAFVAKLNPLGSDLAWSTYLGGNGDDQAFAIAVDGSGQAYVTGSSDSTNVSFPFTPAALHPSSAGDLDAFLTVVDRFGTGNAYSSFLGGTDVDQGNGIAIDANGDAFLTGQTASSSFPTTVGAFDRTFNGSPWDVFVTRLNLTANGTDGMVFALTYSTFLGGGGDDQGRAIAIDVLGNAYVTGRTQGLATTAGAFDTSQNGSFDAFVTKLNPAGTAPLLYSTYLGGGGNDQGLGIALDGGGSAYVTGRTGSTNFPTTTGAQQTTNAGGQDAFVSKLTATGSGLLYSTYLGGSSTDQGNALALDVTGSIYVTGFTSSTNFPTSPGAFDTTQNGDMDAFVTKLVPVGAPTMLVLTPSTDMNPVNTPHTVTATVRDALGQPVPGITVVFSVAGANTATGTCITLSNGQCTFTYTGTHAGTDTITAFADTNGNGTRDATTVPPEPSGTASKLWTAGPPFRMTLLPAADTNQVGDQHCVTATVYDAFDNPVPNITVRFSVPTHVATFAHPFSGSATTDANGQAQFCFTASLPGDDTINAFADTNGNGTLDTGEPAAAATKTWTLPVSTAFCPATVTYGGWIVAMNGDRANFGGNAKLSQDGSTVEGQEEYQDQGPADPMNLHSIEILATTCTTRTDPQTATIFGRATIDGSGDVMFRIDVTEGGHGGANDMYEIMTSDGYDSGLQELQGGNVTIHK